MRALADAYWVNNANGPAVLGNINTILADIEQYGSRRGWDTGPNGRKRGQQDAQEYLTWLLQILQNHTTRLGRQNEIDGLNSLFTIQMANQATCVACAASRQMQPTSQQILMVGFEKDSSLDDFIEDYMVERLQLNCNSSSCGSTQMDKRESITEPPEILFILLKRFGMTMKGAPLKRLEKVKYGDTLDLSAHLDNQANVPLKYELFAVLHHQSKGNGTSIQNGHYITFVSRDSGWDELDDQNVKSSTPLRAMHGNVRGRIRPYLLAFKRIPNINKAASGDGAASARRRSTRSQRSSSAKGHTDKKATGVDKETGEDNAADEQGDVERAKEEDDEVVEIPRPKSRSPRSSNAKGKAVKRRTEGDDGKTEGGKAEEDDDEVVVILRPKSKTSPGKSPKPKTSRTKTKGDEGKEDPVEIEEDDEVVEIPRPKSATPQNGSAKPKATTRKRKAATSRLTRTKGGNKAAPASSGTTKQPGKKAQKKSPGQSAAATKKPSNKRAAEDDADDADGGKKPAKSPKRRKGNPNPAPPAAPRRSARIKGTQQNQDGGQ
ncbi:MAG: hypothetical protein M1833_000226 [Piccolia ochrophora]|nr:MAG: hypothetical protein M1833_000226 [Piccolia ochrophora]